MVGNWKFNIIFGLVAFIITFLFSLPNNTWQTTIFRGSIGFFFFYIFSYFVRVLFFQIISRKANQVIVKDHTDEAKDPLKEESKEVTFEEQFESIPLHALHKEAKTTNNL